MPTPLELLLDPVSLAVIGIYSLLLAWEVLWPARRLPHVPGWLLRGTTAFVAYLLISSYLPLFIAPLLVGLTLFDGNALGTVGGGLLALAGFEALGYAWHRCMHGSDFLFRVVHQMHHSAERFDVPSAFWFSPLDMAGWTLVSTLILSLIGFSPAAVTFFVLVGSLLSTLQHANIRTPHWLGYLVTRPESHSLHHARERHAGNYAALPIYDMLFGTFENPTDFAPTVGFCDGASERVLDMLACRDVTKARS